MSLISLLLVARRAASHGPYQVEAWVFATGCIFLFLLGFQENYWEVTQAILPGVMLLKVLHGMLLNHHRQPQLGATLSARPQTRRRQPGGQPRIATSDFVTPRKRSRHSSESGK